MLSDTFNRQFNYLRLSVTEVCNFKCNYCLPDGYQCTDKQRFLSVSEIQQLVRTFAELGMQKVRITGGEPTLRKDIVEIVASCAQTPGINNVGITTNGYRLPKLLPALADAGLTALNLSADSLNPHTFSQITGSDSLDAVLASVALAQQLGIRKIKLNAVLLKGYNARELQQFLQFVRETPVTIRFIELMQTGDNRAYFEAQHVSGLLVQNQLLSQGWQLVPKAVDAGPALEYWHPQYAGRIGLIMPYSKDFCQSCNRLRVSATGKLHLCLFASENSDLRRYLNPEQQPMLAAHLQQLLTGKAAAHGLWQQQTGLTKQLAMLGG